MSSVHSLGYCLVNMHHANVSVSADDDLMPMKPTSQQQQGRKKKSVRAVSGSSGGGVVYPIDLWFLVGRYVAPEDVCRFACICRDTHVVTHSARFWLTLYRRSASTASAQFHSPVLVTDHFSTQLYQSPSFPLFQFFLLN